MTQKNRRMLVTVLGIFLASLFTTCLKSYAAPAPATPAPLKTQQSSEELGFTPSAPPDEKSKGTVLPGGYVKISGKYRLAAGQGEDGILNDSNPEFQERSSSYIYGERLNNTFDPAVYDQFLLNVDFSPADPVNFYAQIVVDPWSYTGTTGEQVQTSDIGGEVLRYNLKYWGANNSTLPAIARTNSTDSILIPRMKVHDGHVTGGTVAHGFFDYNQATNGIPFTIPELDIDTEFRPFRKLWMDYGVDDWKLRIFALADEEQALTTDDPLELSNHKDYWQWSPWLEEYEPIQHFSDLSIKHGFYSNTTAFTARDSEGNRLVLLRGASFLLEGEKTYIGAEVAAPFSPWDEDFFQADNVPGAVRVKQQMTDAWMLGSTFTFRNGLIDSSIADSRQNIAMDTKYQLNPETAVSAEVARSQTERDLLAGDEFRTGERGYAYKLAVDSDVKHEGKDETQVRVSYTQMDKNFDTPLSRYYSTRDDKYWGQHISFQEYSDDLEHYRIGDGVDINRSVVRLQWKEKHFQERFINLFDARNVHRTENTAYMETVVRDEATLRLTSKLTLKGLIRWHGLPKTTARKEPFISNFYFNGDLVDQSSPNLTFQNNDVKEGKDADRHTYSVGLQYVINPQWTAEGIYEASNNVPDFPRGLLNGVFRDANDRIDGLLVDHLTPFVSNQINLHAAPPYAYFNIFRERLKYKPDERTTITFHAAQNGYHFAGGIDDSINHQGVSVDFQYSKKLNLFFDYTHSRVIDLPHLIASGYSQTQYDNHHNVYLSADYKINAGTVFRAEYGVFGIHAGKKADPYSAVDFQLPTLDTEHLFRASLNGEF